LPWTDFLGLTPRLGQACLRKRQKRNLRAADTLKGRSALSDTTVLAEAPIEHAADRCDGREHGEVAELPVKLRHIHKVHAVNAGNGGGDCEDRRPGGKLSRDVRLLRLTGHQARLESKG